jgi:hypothetical protein
MASSHYSRTFVLCSIILLCFHINKCNSFYVALTPADRAMNYLFDQPIKRDPFFLSHQFMIESHRRSPGSYRMQMPSMFVFPKGIDRQEAIMAKRKNLQENQTPQPYRPSRYIVHVGK